MNIKSSYTIWSIGAFLLSSLAVFLTGLFTRDTNPVMANVIAVAFWMFLILGIFFTISLSKKLRPKKDRKLLRHFMLFKTQQTKVIDTIFSVSLLATIILLIGNIQIGWLQLMFIFLNIFSLELHCVFSLIENKIK